MRIEKIELVNARTSKLRAWYDIKRDGQFFALVETTTRRRNGIYRNAKQARDFAGRMGMSLTAETQAEHFGSGRVS